jgi:pyruvate dehydrogenase E2 component (dihydrolipoamide acetyltransferase)
MAKLFRMPSISADTEEVVLLEWSVKPGTKVAAGDAIAVVETDKANVDITVDQTSILWRSLVEPGTSLDVGTPIAILIGEDEQVTDEKALLDSLGIG